MDDAELQELEGLVAASFPVYESRYDPLEGVAVFLVTVDRERLSDEFSDLKSRLEDHGYIPMLRQEGGEHVIYVVQAPDDDYTRERVNAALFVATVATTILAGAVTMHSYENPARCGFDATLAAMISPTFLGKGALFFALPLVGILGVHELGHYFTARYHDVEASLPFFIPIPPLIGVPIGTMGAFISIRRPITDRKALLDIGIAGPLAGLLVAIPVVVAGAALSAQQPQYVPDEELTTPAGATAVWTGDRVLLAGGGVGGGPTDRIARYDPARDRMVTLDDPLPVHLRDAGGAWTGSAAYLLGGEGPTRTRSGIVRVAADGQATTTGDELPSGRADVSAVWTGEAVLAFGGRVGDGLYTDEIVRYDPATGDVTTLDVTLPTARGGTAAVWTGDVAYVVGGTGGAPLDEVVRVDPQTGSAEVVAELPRNATGASAVWTGDAALLFGGADADGVSEAIVRLDPGSDETVLDPVGGVAQATNTTPNATGTRDRRMELAWNADGTVGGRQVRLDATLATTGRWVESGDGSFEAFRSANGTVRVETRPADGSPGGSRRLALDVERLVLDRTDGGNLSWRLRAERLGDRLELDGPAERTGNATFELLGNGTLLDRFTAERLGADLPSPRTRTAAVWTGEAAYVFGGVNATGAVQHEIVRYDPATGGTTTMRGALPPECRGSFVQLGGPIFGGFGGPEVQGLLFNLLTMPFETDSSAIIHTTAFAGWVGLLVTGLNLLPAGQLDGGHIFRAFLGEKHKYASLGAVGVLLLFGFVGFSGWLIFALLVIVLGTYHPPPLNDLTPLSPSRKILAVLAFAILILTFVPIPFYIPGG